MCRDIFLSFYISCIDGESRINVNAHLACSSKMLVFFSADANHHIIIGCIIGGVGVLLIVAVSLVIAIAWWRKRKGTSLNTQTMYVYIINRDGCGIFRGRK